MLFRSPEPVPAPAPEPIATSPETQDPQQLVVNALAAAGQGTAADAMSDATWTIADGAATVQTQLSKIMLPMVMNPAAEKLTKEILRPQGITRLSLLTGIASNDTGSSKKPRAAKAGSAKAKAMEHPMVQEAQRLFGGEIQTVIDLSESK